MLKSQDVQKVVDRLERAALREGWRRIVNMGNTVPYLLGGESAKKHVCGTVACHAGHYAVQTLLDTNESWKFERNVTEHMFVVTNDSIFLEDHEVKWHDGARLMARDLGFDHQEDLEHFMMDHPEIWGNDQGRRLFVGNSAFHGTDAPYPLVMHHIVEHWKGVAARVRALEESERASANI